MKDGEQPDTREIEFIVIEDDGTWHTEILNVPVHVEWEDMQEWADNLNYRRGVIKYMPWGENPRD